MKEPRHCGAFRSDAGPQDFTRHPVLRTVAKVKKRLVFLKIQKILFVIEANCTMMVISPVGIT
jgi:hypothetical protein